MGITLGGMMSGPMAGVRVIELGVWVADRLLPVYWLIGALM